MKFHITHANEKILTISFLRECLKTGLREAKDYAKGEPFTVPENGNNCAELYLDLLAIGTSVQTSDVLHECQFKRAINDAEWLQYRLAKRIIQARQAIKEKIEVRSG